MVDKSNELRVMHLVNHTLPYQSGYSIRGKAIFDSQKRAGLDPVVVSQYCWGDHRDSIASDKNSHRKTEDGIDYFFYHQDRAMFGKLIGALVNIGDHGLKGSYSVAKKLEHLSRRDYVRRVCNMTKPDLIHAHSGVGQYARWLSRGAGIPWVYEMRGFWEDSFVAEGEYAEWSKLYKKAHFRDTELAMNADAAVVISEAMRRDLINRGVSGEKISVVPNSVDVSTFTPSMIKEPELLERLSLNGKIVAGYITNIRSLEGLDTLIRAIPMITERIPNLHVLIVGDGSYRESLERLVSVLGLKHYVTFTGRVSYDEVRRFYAIMDIFVVPRTNIRVNNMVTPLKPLEAMAMEKAIIVSDVNALLEMVEDGHTGLVFEANNPDSLASKCIKLCSDAILRERLGKEARRWVTKERNPENMAKQYKTIYDHVLG